LGDSFERFSYQSDNDEENQEGEVIFEIKHGVNPGEKILID
jgi:hypothetical protein